MISRLSQVAKRQFPPLHAQGDLRAASGPGRHPARAVQSGRALDHAAADALRPEERQPSHGNRVRDGVLRLPRRQVLDRADRARARGR